MLRVLSLVGLAGCGPPEIDLFLELPRPEGARSLVIAQSAGDEVELYGASLEEAFHLEVQQESESILWAIGLEVRLEDFGISPGRLEPAVADGFGLREGGVVRSYRASVDADHAVAEWEETADVDRRVMDFLIARMLPPCATFSQVESFHVDGSLTFALPLEGDRALLGTNQLDMYIVSPEGLEVVPNGSMRTAFRDGRQIYFGDYFGDVLRAPSDQIDTRELVTTSPLTGLAALAGGEGKILAVSRAGEAAFFDGAVWTMLPPLDVGDERVRAAWGSGEGFYWLRGTNKLTRVSSSGEPTSETIDSSVFSISNLGAFGVVLGTGDGSFLVRQSSAWGTIGGDYGWWGVDSEPYLDGFFFLLASGSVGQFRPKRPFCADQAVLGFINDGQIVVAGRALVAAGWDGEAGIDIKVIGL